jgi:uncharacterized cupredoxin-like copper-binding protein
MSKEKKRMSRISGKVVSLGVVLLLLPVLVGCGPKKIDVSMTSYAIAPSVDTMNAGDVTFHITNSATDQAHEFVIVQTDLAAGQLPVDVNGDVDEEQVTVVDEVEDLQPAAVQDLSVNLAGGHYVLMCNQPGHYKQGMYLDFTVQ